MAAFTRPWGIAIDSNGYIFVTDTTDQIVQKFDANGTYVTFIGGVGSGDGQFISPRSIACDTANNVYVVDLANSRIQKLTNTLVYSAQWGSYASPSGDNTFRQMGGIAISPTNEVWVSDNEEAGDGTVEVKRYNTSGVFQQRLSIPVSYDGGEVKLYLYIDPAGTLWAIDNYNAAIYKIENGSLTETISISGLGLGSSDLGGFTIFNSMFILPDYFGDQLVFSDALGSQIGTWGTSGTGNEEFDIPTDMDVTSDGALWIVDSGNARLQKALITIETILVVTQGGLGHTITTDTRITLPTPDQPPGDRDEPYDEEDPYPLIGVNSHNVILPHVYGDMTVNSDAGVWVCPCIDTNNDVYCAAAWPVLSVANGNVVSVYADGTLVSSGYTFTEDFDFENKGRIAIINFTSTPAEPVTVRMKGKPTTDGGAVLMENPVDIIEDWLDYCTWLLGRETWEKDSNNLAQARARAETNHYTASGVIQGNNTIGTYLQNILNSFWGAFRFNALGELQLFFKSLVDVTNIQETLEEHEAIQLRVRKDIEQVINQIEINYAISYTQIDRRYRNGGNPSYFRTTSTSSGTDTRSVLLYGTRTTPGGPLNFDWNRVTESVETIRTAFLDAFNDPEFIVRYQGADYKYGALEIADQVSATFSLVRDTNNAVAQNVTYEVRDISSNFDDFTTELLVYSLNFLDLKDRIGGVYIGTEEVYISSDKVYIIGIT